ncbi:MAG: hypothetical protein ACRCVB_05180 [Cetobacterium sp.]|uniref:hypothetical protein n=2 Tax=unclassified Cetobacterium TaxID=2630983 RepID=UPI000647C6B5|nr:hypothetical protein [Cetobacterium sp. ZOR0034]
MKNIKMLFSFKVIYIVSLIYFFLGYFYPNFLQINNVYLYLHEYLGIYEKMLWVFLITYGFSLFMKNPNKRVVLKVRLVFMIILGIATGYLYLVDSLRKLGEIAIDGVQEHIIQIGLLNINLGYIELYTFLKIFPHVREDIFIGCLIFLIFISVIIICGKMIRKSILSIINLFKRHIARKREEKRLKEERIRLEKQAKLEKDIYDEICNIQKIYQEKDSLEELGNNEDELMSIDSESFDGLEEDEIKKIVDIEEIEREEEHDISIKISETERDIKPAGISIGNKD